MQNRVPNNKSDNARRGIAATELAVCLPLLLGADHRNDRSMFDGLPETITQCRRV